MPGAAYCRFRPQRRSLLPSVWPVTMAAVILITEVLPAEYGIDPFGTGKALGLLALARAGNADRVPPRRKVDGTFTAPVSGIHGWYWENRIPAATPSLSNSRPPGSTPSPTSSR